MSRGRNKLLDIVGAQRYHVGVYLLGANMVGGKETHPLPEIQIGLLLTAI
ncbi:hypothetical protein BDK62_10713 [Halomonas alkaliantarctica]|jgi:hypothetical protein|nr:hypothetical protein BDK62_10713 [Halomonas alkaliantarctica]